MSTLTMKSEMEAFKNHILKTAEDMVVNKFPNRIVMLNKMLGSGKLTLDPSTVFQKINIPVPDVSEISSNASTATHQHQEKQRPSADDGKKQSADQMQAATSNGESGVS